MGYKRILDPGYALYVWNGTSAEPKQITPNSADAYCPAISPDGRWVAFVNNADRDLWVVNVDGTGLRKVTDALYEVSEPKFSSDGRLLVFAGITRTNAQSDIFTVDIDGKNLKNITLMRPAKDSEDLPSLSHDGKLVAYVVGHEVWVMELSNSNAKKVCSGEYPMFLPGNDIGFTGLGDNSFAFVSSENGTYIRKVSEHPAYDRCYFSSNGKVLSYRSLKDSRVYVSNIAGERITQESLPYLRWGMPAVWSGN
jgi:tricorn protease-like protein